jgi:hypothetical protein
MEGFVDSMKSFGDMLERAAWTFAQAFLAIFVLGDMASLKGAAVAGGAAALSVIKTYAKDRVK